MTNIRLIMSSLQKPRALGKGLSHKISLKFRNESDHKYSSSRGIPKYTFHKHSYPKGTYDNVYYKVFREDMIHNDHKYKVGFNMLNKPLDTDEENSCTDGGFYITRLEYIHLFLPYGNHIRKVYVPIGYKY